MTIPYSTDHGLRNAVLLELAGNVAQAGGVIAAPAGETHPNWVMFLNRIITAANAAAGGAPLPTYLSLDYSAFDTVVKAVQRKIAVAPANTVAPVCTSVPLGGAAGTAILSCTTGTWTGTAPITYTRQWQRNGANIAGQTGLSYTTQVADSGQNITCVVMGTNIAGSAQVSSNAIVPA